MHQLNYVIGFFYYCYDKCADYNSRVVETVSA